jgi:replicative DNA helicase
MDRTPPNDVAAERVVLGAMMQSAGAIGEASTVLTVDDFYQPKNATVFATIMNQHADGKPVDAVAIADRLMTDGELMRVGGAPYLHTLLSEAMNPGSTSYYARIVADHAARRRLLEGVLRVQALAYGGNELDETLEAAEQAMRLDRIRHNVSASVESEQAVEAALADLERADGAVRGIPTGVPHVDNAIGGLQDGHLIIVGGRPGMGKSLYTMDIARRASVDHDKRSLVFSMEMTHVEVAQRWIAAQSDVALDAIRRNRLTDSEAGRVQEAVRVLRKAELVTHDDQEMTLGNIRSVARARATRQGVDLIVVDYLQIVKAMGGQRDTTRQQLVGEVAVGLKAMARELEVPVVAAAQLNRGVESRADRIPTMSDLRESGEIEQAADIVILLYRPDYYRAKDEPMTNDADIIVEKNRHGRQGFSVPVMTLMDRYRFEPNWEAFE